MAEKEKVVYSIEEIMAILPHRYPFILVDKVVDLFVPENATNRVGRKAVAIKNVTINEPFFQGHFPHRPVMPGVLQVEAMAQAGALAAYDKNIKKMDVAIASMENVKFRTPVIPGDVLKITVEVVKDRGSMIVIEGMIEVNGKKVSEATMKATIFPMEER